MKRSIDGIAFDLDGTLYPNYQLYFRVIPFIIKEFPLLLALGKARSSIRRRAGRDAPLDGFYDLQAELMGAYLKQEAPAIRRKTEELIYRGWEPLFKRIPLYPGVRPLLEEFRGLGFKLGLLSDFPPETKALHLKVTDCFDVLLCSESIGRLKPDPLPFLTLAKAMGLPPERILYVGNSMAYDVKGAKGAGMQAAWITWPWRSKGGADFVFSHYRQLSAYVLR